MRFRFLEIVTSIERIEPGVDEELGPITVPQDKAAGRKSFLVLCEDKVHIFPLQMRERLDDAVGRDDGVVFNHDVLQLARSH